MQIPENNYDEDNFWENCPAAQVSPDVPDNVIEDLLRCFYRLETECWSVVRRCEPFCLTCTEDVGSQKGVEITGDSSIRRGFEGIFYSFPITFLY